MSKRTRCKFQVWSVKSLIYPSERIELKAVYADGDPENESFAAATPQGTLTITVDNPAVIGSFKPGQTYYLDLTPADEGA